jgi:uncharacterized protein (DUF2384 family)
MARSRTPTTPAKNKPASRSVTGAAFWALMARWDVPEDQALQLIDQPASASDKRPRFALSTEQAERLDLLYQIDHTATDIHHSPAGDWLLRPNSSTLFGRCSPIAFMAGGGRPAIEATLRHLQMLAFGGSVAKPRGRR